jgi:hypothetical protein
MKHIAQSMTPQQAAKAFFGQDDASFAETVAMLTKNDPRLAKVFLKTRERFLDSEN